MNLASKSTGGRLGGRQVIELRGRRWPVSYAVPAFATTAVWLFLTVWLPAGEMPPMQEFAPVATTAVVPQAGTGWPAPTVGEEASLPAEPAATF